MCEVYYEIISEMCDEIISEMCEKNDDNKPPIIINMKNYVIKNKKNGDKILIKSK